MHRVVYSTYTDLLDDQRSVPYIARATKGAMFNMSTLRGRMVEGGRIIVPAEFRRQMGIAKGDTVLFEMHGDELRVRPARAALRQLQGKLKAYADPGVSVADELIAQRRAEAERE